MSKTELIEHIDHHAIVEEVNAANGTLTVRIDDPEECGDCPASKLCESKGQPSNKVVISTPNASSYRIGDIITVRGTEKMHRKAIMYATVYPCIILVAVMVGLYLLTGSQLTAALSGVGVTIIFYVILYLCRNKVAHEFTFTVIGQPERAGEEK